MSRAGRKHFALMARTSGSTHSSGEIEERRKHMLWAVRERLAALRRNNASHEAIDQAARIVAHLESEVQNGR